MDVKVRPNGVLALRIPLSHEAFKGLPSYQSRSTASTNSVVSSSLLWVLGFDICFHLKYKLMRPDSKIVS